jgi:hypothetical protein
MDTQKFVYALEGEGMEPEQAAIIAAEIYRIYAHSVLGGVYQPVDYGDFEALRAKANLMRAKTEAMDNVLRAMRDGDRDQEEHWQAEMERIDAE